MTLLILVFAAIVLYYPILFLRVKLYFLQDFASMTPQQRIERFDWKMYVWRYRFSSKKVLLKVIGFNDGEEMYGKNTFEALYPPGNSVDELFQALSKRPGYCFEFSDQSLKRLLSPEEIQKNISVKLCGYLYLASLYGLYPIPLIGREWKISVKYNKATRKLIDYKVSVAGDGL